MTRLLSTNLKMTHTNENNEGYRFFDFNLPAVITCPHRGECEDWCYARKGRYIFKNVIEAQMWRLNETRKTSFIQNMEAEIRNKRDYLDKQDIRTVIRIHSSGDFYSKEYTEKWFKICNDLPTVIFYAYTKCIKMFKDYKKENKIPENLIIIFSHGSDQDELIEDDDRQARMFKPCELIHEPWVDATGNDMIALTATHIALPYH